MQQKATKWLKNDVHDTSNIENVCIYVEQAIQRLKEFRESTAAPLFTNIE